MIIKDIPNYLECAYCIRNHSHGGECRSPKHSDKGCLGFKLDPKGCIRQTDMKIPVPLYHDFPQIGEWCDYWMVNGQETEVRIDFIRGIQWDSKKGYLIIRCRVDYYVNEYRDDYEELKSKPKLKLIK